MEEIADARGGGRRAGWLVPFFAGLAVGLGASWAMIGLLMATDLLLVDRTALLRHATDGAWFSYWLALIYLSVASGGDRAELALAAAALGLLLFGLGVVLGRATHRRR